MTTIECDKCNKLNKKLDIENPEDYEAICDVCWDKRVDEYESSRHNL